MDALERGAEFRRRRNDRQRGMIIAADLMGVGVDVDEALTGRWNVEQRIALGGRLRHAAADEHDEVGPLDPRLELRIGGEADLAGIIVVFPVEGAGPAEGSGDRQVEAFGEAREGRARAFAPARSAEDRDRVFGAPEHLLQLGHLREARPDRRRRGARSVRRRRGLNQHVLRQRDHHRARPSLHGDVERALDDLGYLGRVLDLGRPFGDRAEKGSVVHLLEGPAANHRPLDLADEQDHRRGIVLGDVDAVRGVGRARTARDEAHAGSAGQAAFGQRHHRRPRLLTADGDLDRRVRTMRRARQDRIRPECSRPARRPGPQAGRRGYGRRCVEMQHA